MSDLISSLRNSRTNSHRYLTEYLNLRSRLGNSKYILIFEGDDDLIVYDIWIKRITKTKYEPLPVNGKDNVLKVFSLICNSESPDDNYVLFFADKDFDNSKGYVTDSRFYMTESYSIENYIISDFALEELLVREFKMTGEEQAHREKIISLFNSRYDEFIDISIKANAFIKWMRDYKVECLLPDEIHSLMHLSLEKVSTKDQSISRLMEIFSSSATPFNSTIEGLENELKSIDLKKHGRGKFIFDFIKKFLLLLYSDRRSSKPNHFIKRVGSCSDPTQDLMRKLTNYSATPPCIESFIRRHMA